MEPLRNSISTKPQFNHKVRELKSFVKPCSIPDSLGFLERE
jgi:hypothetical protein